jgi:predicted nucleotidyltransferase
MDWQELPLSPQQRGVVDRFVAACQADERIVAATLSGSYARGEADAYSDIDLDLILTDEAFEEFCAEREAFVHLLGEPLFLEGFGSTDIVFFIFADGTEGEMTLARESHFDRMHRGPYIPLLDKRNILAGVEFSESAAAEVEQIEVLRRQVYGFWHELSHFLVAMHRGQLWWAHGQLEAMRLICVNLKRLQYNFADPYVEGDYFKVENAIPAELLAPLQTTFCAHEAGAIGQAALVLFRFYQDLAPSLCQAHGMEYPERLERVMAERLEQLLGRASPL